MVVAQPIGVPPQSLPTAALVPYEVIDHDPVFLHLCQACIASAERPNGLKARVVDEPCNVWAVVRGIGKALHVCRAVGPLSVLQRNSEHGLSLLSSEAIGEGFQGLAEPIALRFCGDLAESDEPVGIEEFKLLFGQRVAEREVRYFQFAPQSIG